jgi:DNA segregation ATPase FtsK/SpoIIIE, S-DNA-T family
VDFLREEAEAPAYEDAILQTKVDEGTKTFDLEGDEGEDALYEEARALVIQAGKASSSYLQRRLRIGYARAARLLDLLESNGVVGPGEGAKPREVLMKGEEGGESGEFLEN